MSERTFALFKQFLPETRILGLATGNTPLGFYNIVSRSYKEGEISLKYLHTFNLDKYYGIEETHHESYHTFLNEHVFPLNELITETGKGYRW